MASCNVEFPLIGDGSNVDDGDAGDNSANAAFYSQSSDILPYAADDSSDPNRSSPCTPNGSRDPYPHKKQKRDAGAADSNGRESRGEYRKDREEWSDTAIACLLDAYTEKFIQLSRGNLRGKDWEEVAEIVSRGCDNNSRKRVEQCKNKIDNLKKRYKVELQRMNNGGLIVSQWHWFKQMEVIVGNSKSISDEDRSGGGNSAYILRQHSKRFTPTSAVCLNSIKPKLMPNPKWRRVVFRISGTALVGNCQNIDPKIQLDRMGAADVLHTSVVALHIAKEIASACRLGVEVAVVLGGRNFFCGDSWVTMTGLDRSTAYQIGMMATVMNSVLLQSAIEKLGIETCVQSAFSMPEVTEPYNRVKAIRHLEKGRVVIFGGVGASIGNPLFSTDTAAALRASENALVKGTNANCVFDGCSGDSTATTSDHISFREVVSRGVTSMDMMSIQHCQENGISVVVFNLLEPGNISRALCGDQIGTLIDQTGKIN